MLKIHSKKSPHRTDGQEWFNDMLGELVPDNPKTLKALIDHLSNSSTGIIGPAGQYISLVVNFEANAQHLAKILKKLRGNQHSKTIMKNNDSYGFFAGTMFWARIDAIAPILDKLHKPIYFEKENGQIDGTFAHAIERALCLLPQMDGKLMYEISQEHISQIPYKTDNIPEWSDVYIGPKG